MHRLLSRDQANPTAMQSILTDQKSFGVAGASHSLLYLLYTPSKGYIDNSPSQDHALLQADDKDFKTELGRVVEMDVWDNTKVEAVRQLKDAVAQLARLEQEQEMRTIRLQELSQQVPTARAE